MQSYNPNILIGSNFAVTLLNGCVSTPAEGEPHLFGVVMEEIWESIIKINNKTVNLGYFHTAVEARQAYLTALTTQERNTK